VHRVLVSDRLSDEGIRVLEEAEGIELDVRPGVAPDELAKIIPDYDALIVRSGTKVTGELIERAERLRVIGRAGIGVDNVDLAAATARGVIVMNTPEGNAITTAEHAISLMTALARQIPQATASLRAGRWEKAKFSGKELFDQVLGVIGLGNIGSIVADRALGLRMRVIAFDPLVSEDRAQRLGVDLVPLDELVRRADVISVHVPLTKETRGLIGRAAFEKMKRGVLLVNAARGGIVDEEALAWAIQEGIVAGAALDVFEQEPPPPDHPLLQLDNVIATPHLGAATAQAQVNVAVAVAQQVRDYLRDGIVRNAVNLPSVSAEQLAELRPYIVLGEKLGLFQGQRCESGAEEIDIEYAGQVAGQDVQPVTLAVLKGFLEPWVGEGVNYVNAPVLAQQRGIRVIESKAAEPEDFVSLLTVRLRARDGTELRVSGTIFGRTQPRIVRVEDFLLEAIPEGATLVIHNEDRPGIVGQVGTILGRGGVNIARMQLGLQPGGGQALQLLNVDPAPSDAVLAELRAIRGMLGVRLIELGAGVS
jgi:D-3-phosphoglycerate dehydrogenase